MRQCKPGRVLFQALILVTVGLMFGVADAVIRRDRVNLHLTAPPPPPPQPPPKPDHPPVADSHPTGGGEAPKPTPPEELPTGHITLAQAKVFFDQGVTFVDARKSEVYVQGHVKGAIRLDLASFAQGDPPLLGLFPTRPSPVIVYCSGGHCDESEQVAKMLNGSGYTAVYVMHDGFPGWKDAGYPVETGDGIQP